MDAIPSILMIILIIIVAAQNSKLNFSLKLLEDRLKKMQSMMTDLAAEKKRDTKPAEPEKTYTPPPAEPKPYVSIFKREEEAVAQTENMVPPVEIPLAEAVPKENISAAEAEQPVGEKIKLTGFSSADASVPKPSFFERHPDMEKFIGENLVSKIGIAVLVLAIGFFVKYAIDNDWIGPVGRVAVGIGCGGILVALAHRLRNSYRPFSSVLAGGGLAVFYFTITLAYHQFHLFEQTSAFIIMIVITAFAVALSLLYNKQELAVIALAGGFAAPFLVSNGNGNYVVLFTYLIVLNTGLLIIAYFRSWRLLNILSFIFTVVLFGGWLASLTYHAPPSVYRNALVFASVFYLLFFVINIAYNIRERKKFIASDFGILLLNTGLYFSVGLYCLSMMNAASYNGFFSAGMGIFNLCASYFLFRKDKADKNILYLLIGLTLTFVSVTAPLQLHGHYITLFWACETVLLYWLFTKSKIRLIRISSLLLWAMMLLSLLMDWMFVYNDSAFPLPIIVNKGFITAVFCAIATYFIFLLKSREATADKKDKELWPGRIFFRVAALTLLFLAGALEINYQFSFYYPESGLHILYTLLYVITFINILLFINSHMEKIRLRSGMTASLFSVCLVLYLAAVALSYSIQGEMLETGKYQGFFIAHWLIAAWALYDFWKLVSAMRKDSRNVKAAIGTIAWLLCGFIVFLLSHEVLLLCNGLFYSAQFSLADIQQVYIKSCLPVLWGLCSFAFMWLGMHYKFRTLRIISLSLFLLTLLKLFIFDIRNVSAGGKIAAFFSLGVLLLVVSFMYQRLKKIIIDNEKKD